MSRTGPMTARSKIPALAGAVLVALGADPEIDDLLARIQASAPRELSERSAA